MLLAAAATSTTPATADSHVLTVRSDGSGYVDVDVQQRTPLYTEQGVVVGGGRWAALVIRPLHDERPPRSAALFRLPVSGQQVLWSGWPELTPGRYRLALVAERPVEVRLPTGVSGWRPLVARHQADGRLLTGSKAVAPGSSDAGVRLPAGRSVAAVMALRVTGQRLEDTFICVTREPDCDRTLLALPGGVPVDPGTGLPSTGEGPFASMTWGSLAGHSLLFRARGQRTTAGAMTAQAVTIS